MPLSIELLPARYGDAILVRWGDPADPHRMLVDAGPATAYREIAARLTAEKHLDLVVLTHVDADHVEGLILLFNDVAAGIGIDEVWFNGMLSGTAREMTWTARTAATLSTLRSSAGDPLERAVRRPGGAQRRLNENWPVELPGGLRVTIVAPSSAELRALDKEWARACHEANIDGTVQSVLDALHARPRLVPSESYLAPPPRPNIRKLAGSGRSLDNSATNASTIVLLLEIDDRAVLLCGDATPRSLLTAIQELKARRPDILILDAMTVPHHGSERNITAELVKATPSRRYLCLQRRQLSQTSARGGRGHGVGVRASWLRAGIQLRHPLLLAVGRRASARGVRLRRPVPGVVRGRRPGGSLGT